VRYRYFEMFSKTCVKSPLQMTYCSLEQRLQNKRHRVFLVSMKGLSFLAFLFSLKKGKSETEDIPKGEQQNLEGNQPEAPFQ